MTAWTTRQKREDTRLALIQLTVCQAQGVKISGRKPKLDDFLPDYAKPKRTERTPEQAEAQLKAAFASLAKSKKPNG